MKQGSVPRHPNLAYPVGCVIPTFSPLIADFCLLKKETLIRGLRWYRIATTRGRAMLTK